MKSNPILAAVPLLLLLLTWVLVHSIDTDAERFDRALDSLDDFATVENALRRDVLAARAGLLHDYDPLVREVATLQRVLDRLHEVADVDREIAAAIDGLSATVTRQEDLVERFKSDNALLQNSLAYFGLFSTRFGGSDEDRALAADVGALAAAILHLTLDTSRGAIRDAENRLADLAAHVPPSGTAEPLQVLLAHGQILRDLLPATDGVLRALFALPASQQQTAIRNAVLQREIASRETAREYRLLLYGMSVVLVGLLIILGLRLRARALALRRRAAFEHLIAGISTRLITARRQQTEGQIEQALAELATHIGADRAYAIFGGPSHQRYVWSRDGVACPPDWPDRALALSRRLRPAGDGVVHIRRADRLPPGADRDALTAAGLRGWACVSGRGSEGAADILGFDALQPSAMARAGELGLLRMAFDAIANAVGRDHLEREQSQLEDRLQQARRMESVGALASGIAHNFNNIVGVILGYTEMAEAEAGPDGRPVRHLAQIHRAGERARDLVDQILAYGRRRPASRLPLKVQDLVAETVSLLRASLPGTIELAVRQTDDDALVSGEPAQLQQVILNLCSNAAQAMDGIGRIDIDVAFQDVAAMRVLGPGTLMPGRYVRIAVVDAGRGIDAEILDRIFEPFFTMRQDGNGLGLATVREIVREHGGMIDVWSRPGVGSRFEVWLPRATTRAASDREAAPFLGHGEAVLMLYDDRTLLLRDEETLAALGYDPVGFTSTPDALAACRAAPGQFGVLMVSHGASSRSALELAAALHEIAPHLPILLAVASSERIDADSLAAAGVFEVVRRPLVSADIAAVLRNTRSRNRELIDSST